MNEGMVDTAAVRTTAIPGLVSKLALHPLPDVRRRSLSSLHFKLEHGLVSAREAGECGAVEAVLGALERGEGMQLAAATLIILSEDAAAKRKILVRVHECFRFILTPRVSSVWNILPTRKTTTLSTLSFSSYSPVSLFLSLDARE